VTAPVELDPRVPFQDREAASATWVSLFAGREGESLRPVGSRLMEHLAGVAEPDRGLRNFARIVESVGRERADFFRGLVEEPEHLRALVYLAGWSDYLAGLVASVPGLIRRVFELFEGQLADERFRTLIEEGRRQVEAGEPREAVATMQARELAMIAIRDLDGLEALRVSRAMSALAEAITKLLLEIETEAVAESWGRPVGGGERFAVLGCGKMGSGELVYGSDLDVIFVCDPGGFCEKRDAKSGGEFWTRVVQGLKQRLEGPGFYELDARLRPWGIQGQLVITTQTLERYWGETRDVWERLAMTRIAPIAGDVALGLEATEIVRASALGAPLPDDAVQQVVDMRAKLEETVGGKDHVKHGPGGYVDAEFIAQFFSLGRGADELPVGASIEQTLRALASARVIPFEASVELCEALTLLRRIEARMRLRDGGSGSELPVDPDARAGVARRLDLDSAEDLDTRVAHARERSRHWFSELLGPVPPRAG
jgi:glutamate-ammonia-ligase adenylyltransferase